MDIGSWGGGLVLALVAVLWLVYLVPTWQRRQEYLATERNAVRLQQTLRILAQTAELPEEVRIEANAKSVADAQRILAREEAKREALRRAHEAARQRAVTRELAAAAPVLRAADHDPVLAARRLRRSRLVSTLVLVASVVAVVAGLVVSSWVVSVAGLAFGGGAVAMLAQLSAVSQARARRQATTAPRVAQPLRDFSSSLGEPQPEAEPASREWTPVPVPAPLYLRRGRQRPATRPAAAAAAAAASARAGASAPESPADELRRQSERSVQALRESQRAQHQALREAARAEAALSAPRVAAPSTAASGSTGPAAAPPAQAAPAAPSRFARMGIVDDLGEPSFRLDEALERRRAV
jgi:hypothetical protein